MNRFLYSILLVCCVLCSCGGADTKPAEPKKQRPTHYARNLKNQVRIYAYDVYGSKIADGIGTYIDGDIVVTPMDWINGAFKANVTPLDSKTTYPVYGYVAYDIDDNLVALRIGLRSKELNPLDTASLAQGDTLYSIDSKQKKTLKTTQIYNGSGIASAVPAGTALFDLDGNIRAIAAGGTQQIGSQLVDKIAHRLSGGHQNLYELRLKTNKQYPSYKQIKGFRIVTTKGNITIRLLNETPEYRDNFIKLVCDDFYDSLLVHRVLQDYLIQTGAADSKYAKADDIVGWQGPGYTLPMQIVNGLFHKRGMVAASKLPSDRNKNNRSDGSQFFIVAGRKFTQKELDDIEKEYDKKFSAAQRAAYTTVGGAPYLDGDYTIFAEVTSGMDVVDRIAAVKLNGDRPVTDIRVKDIEIIK